MKALLLAAGLGTRLQPITNTVPKCLVPINGKLLLEIWLDTLVAAGIEEFLINTHHLDQQVSDFVDKSIYKEKITLIYEKNLLGTGGSILKNKNFFTIGEPFMVVHADNFSVYDYKKFIFSHKLKPVNTIMTMMTFITDTPQTCGIVELNNDNVVINFYEKGKNPPSNLANGAVYIFDYQLFELLHQVNRQEIDISTEVLPLLLGKIYTHFNDNIHIDIGTIENLEKARKIVHVPKD